MTADSDLELAVCSAPGKGTFPARVISPQDVGVEHRGKERNQRLVLYFRTTCRRTACWWWRFTPRKGDQLWPSSQHDTALPGQETQLEETYYHRFDPPQGFAFQRVYTDDHSLDTHGSPTTTMWSWCPRGYHPVAAIAGYDSYYLNVMAGPDRKWMFTWEEDHAWINSPDYPRHD